MDDKPKQRTAAQRDGALTAKPRAPRVSSRIDPISAGLRALWSSLENEPVPDEFLALLDQMDAGPDADEPPPIAGPKPGPAA